MAVLQFPTLDFHPRGNYELKMSQVQHFNSVIHRCNCRLLNINNLNPTLHYMYHQFNIQQLYALPTLYLCVYLIANSDLCHLLHQLIGFKTEMKRVYSAVRTGALNTAF